MADTVVARTKLETGDLLVKGTVNTRLPAVTNGLVAYLPCDGRGGTFDVVGGHQPTLHTVKGVNLVEAMNMNWRDPSSWTVANGDPATVTWDDTMKALRIQGNHYLWFKTPIYVDTTKHYAISCEVYQENDEMASTNYTRLYLGGRGLTAAGANYTTNYDYSIKSNWDVPLGVWHYCSLTRYGAGNYPTGWTSTNGLCQRYYFGGLFNYYGGANSVIYIRNISIVVTDDDTSSFIYDDDGLGIHDITTNLWTGDQITYNNYLSYITTTRTVLSETFMGQPIVRYTFKPLDDTRRDDMRTTYGNHGMYGGYIMYSANLPYWASVYWRCNKSSVSVEGSPSNISGWSEHQTVDLGNGWKRSYSKHFHTGAQSDNKFWGVKDPTINTNEVVTIDFVCPQIEQKTFATGYGTRAGVSALVLNDFALSNFTIAFDFTSDAEYYKTEASAYSKTMVAMYDADLTRSIVYRDYTTTPGGAVVSSYPYFDLEPDASWDNVMHHWHHYVPYQKRKEHTYFMIKSGATMRIVVKDGVTTLRDQTFTYSDSSLMTSFVLTRLRFGLDVAGVWSGSFKRIAVYNKALSNDEIAKFCGEPFTPTSTGNLILRGITEKPLMPADCFYFPLGHDAKDFYHIVSPNSGVNLVFDDSAVFLPLDPKAELEYNLYRDLGLQWNADWSIVYWKMPIAGYTGNTGSNASYNIDSLGCNGNSVGGYYIWWGKDNGNNTIASATPLAVDPVYYFDHWHAISLVHSGNTLTIKHWNINGQTHVRTTTLPTTALANCYVTQYDYDLKLGGWNNIYTCPSWYRDLIVAKRALTDDELNTLINSPFRLKPNGIQVRGAIQGGVTL